MGPVHHMALSDEMFKAISNGTKKTEVGLYDAKRQSILPGEYIIFTNEKDAARVAVSVISVHVYMDFNSLFE